ncbi:hypothetical protein Micbo1qcDRAFT_164653, partial [Microdochium bolleyi]
MLEPAGSCCRARYCSSWDPAFDELKPMPRTYSSSRTPWCSTHITEDHEEETESLYDEENDSTLAEVEEECLRNFCSRVGAFAPWDEETIIPKFVREERLPLSPQDDSRQVALLDEYDDSGSSIWLSTALEASELAKNLGGNGRSNVEEAAIRRIYIPNLTPVIVRCLARAATPLECRVLPDFMEQHLEGTPVIEARILPDGYKTFCFEFHLPHLILRTDRIVRKDYRRLSGRPLRHEFQIPCLDKGNDMLGSFDIIYQAVTSCLIVGSFSKRWTGYMLTDSYFVNPDKTFGEDCIEYWTEERADHAKPDPFTLGRSLSDCSFTNARDYFINTFSTRVERIMGEWRNLVTHLTTALDHQSPLLSHKKDVVSLREESHIPRDPDDSVALRDEGIWLDRAMGLVQVCHRSLGETVVELERFLPTAISMFCDGEGRGAPGDRPQIRHDRVASITRTTQQLSRLHTRLESLRDTLAFRSECVRKELTSRLVEEAAAQTHFQSSLVNANKQAGLISVVCIPIVMVSILLSITESALPLNPSPQTALIVFLVFQIVISSLWFASSSRRLVALVQKWIGDIGKSFVRDKVHEKKPRAEPYL